tara:strand:+ start:16 stop:534 length:519 start_codon:yes stop_codon:yes gene_type:complete
MAKRFNYSKVAGKKLVEKSNRESADKIFSQIRHDREVEKARLAKMTEAEIKKEKEDAIKNRKNNPKPKGNKKDEDRLAEIKKRQAEEKKREDEKMAAAKKAAEERMAKRFKKSRGGGGKSATGLGIKTSAAPSPRKKLKMLNMGGAVKSNKGAQDFRKGGMVLSTVDNRKTK